MVARSQRLWVTVVGAAAASAVIAAIGQSVTAAVPVSGSSSNSTDWEKVAAAVHASVVSIQETTANGAAQGSGVILDAAGHVLTNNHVVAHAQSDSLQVTLSDGRVYKATIVGTDATTDLAVVQITSPPSDLTPAALGDSSTVVVVVDRLVVVRQHRRAVRVDRAGFRHPGQPGAEHRRSARDVRHGRARLPRCVAG